MRVAKGLVASVAVALMLAACSSGTAQQAPAPQNDQVQAPSPTVAPPTQTPEQEPLPTEAPPTKTPPPLDSDEIPKGSSALKASPPNEVSLTGDRPRLVEFFAFW